MKRLMRHLRRGERGQMLMLAAGLFPIVLGMAGIAVDVGSYASERRTLQNAADSVALAAAQELPDQSAAISAGQQYATRHGIPLSEVSLQFSGSTSTTPLVRATITSTHNFSFMKVLGIQSKAVAGKAAAVRVSFGGGAGIVPWTITEDTQLAADLGEEVVMKYDSNGGNLGNFGAIRIDGSGSAIYGDSVKYGSDYFACAVTAANCTPGACPGVYPATCSENAPECDGAECSPETGNMIGKTREGVDFRMTHTMSECDTFDEVFSAPDPITGISLLNPDCNPWTDGPGSCTSDTDMCSRRVIIIPVIDEFGNGASDPGTIQRFAILFLEGYDSGKCQGNECEIKGRFVRADVNPGALSGTFDPDAPIHFTRLSE